ncbi:iron-containing alcohol dehydrogenase [Bacillus licheniformis]|nr:iron-containing alcohol dehydrogenase [Bacillus licheniformis]
MDAFTHSLESFISTKANPISDMFALESIRLISASIVEAYETVHRYKREKHAARFDVWRNGADGCRYCCRSRPRLSAWGKYRISHGVANSMLLPHVMEFNMDAITERLSLAAETMGIVASDLTAEQAAEAVVQK